MVDAFSEALDSLALSGAVYCHARLRGAWGFRTEASDDALFLALVEGGAVLERSRADSAHELEKGDLVLLPRGDAFTLRYEPGGPVRPTNALSGRGDADCPCHIAYGDSGPETRLIAGGFSFEDEASNPLVQALPPLLHVRSDAPPNARGELTEWLRMTIDLLEGETEPNRPGSELTSSRLTEVLVVQALRRHFSGSVDDLLNEGELGGWMRAVNDEQIGRALAAVHERPARPWSVEQLAEHAYMSRTAFAERFRELLGESPMRYVTRWRMQTASSLLRRDETATVAEAADAAGYDSVSSFSRAFKREVGLPPGSYREKAHSDSGV